MSKKNFSKKQPIPEKEFPLHGLLKPGTLAREESKIRIRTEEELDLQAQGLKEVRDIFNALEIPYYLAGGTLLGIIRDGDFIRWDWDVGIDVKTEDVRPKQDAFIVALKKSGFYIREHIPTKTYFKIDAYKYRAIYEIVGYFKLGKMRCRHAQYYPDIHYHRQTEVTLRGEKYTTFNLPEKYLEWYFGDWKTPVRTADKDVYLITKCTPGLAYKILIKIVKIISLGK